MHSLKFTQKWLDRVGYKLGYDIHNIPELKYWHLIERLGLYAHNWYGYGNNEEYIWHEDKSFRAHLDNYERG